MKRLRIEASMIFSIMVGSPTNPSRKRQRRLASPLSGADASGSDRQRDQSFVHFFNAPYLAFSSLAFASLWDCSAGVRGSQPAQQKNTGSPWITTLLGTPID